jgi:putative FmdB family regulatory protein
MPIYEYECTNCHQQFDVLQKMSEEPVRQCPNCLNDTAIRLVSAAGFQLKGNGWYATDFKNKTNDGVKKETKTPEVTPAATKTSTESKKGEKA